MENKDAEALSREAFESAPVNEAPMNGEIVSVLYPMRYLPYKKDGQRQMGVKGRWQEYTGYGWKNADFTPERFLKPLERAQPAPAAGDGINWARNILAAINAWKAGEDDGGGVIAKAESYAKAALAYAESQRGAIAALPAPSVGEAEFSLLSVLADIRQRTGVGQKPMLSELSRAIVAILRHNYEMLQEAAALLNYHGAYSGNEPLNHEAKFADEINKYLNMTHAERATHANKKYGIYAPDFIAAGVINVKGEG